MHCLSVVAYKDFCTGVHGCPSDDPAYLLRIKRELVWSVSLEDKAKSYPALRDRVSEYLFDNQIRVLLMKKGSLGRDGRGRASTSSAGELRGVIWLAAHGACKVVEINKGTATRLYGDKSIDEYVRDSLFWMYQVDGCNSRIHREAAMLLIAANKLSLLAKK